MIEEIKKEINEQSKHIITRKNKIKYDNFVIGIYEVEQILNKYKDKEIKFEDGNSKFAIVKVPKLDVDNIKNYNQPDYKSAFEKILDIQMDIDGTTFGECFDTQVQDIKDEYNLGGE